MKVLLVGNGGREHALARALIRTATDTAPVDLIVQAGNPGLEPLGRSLVFNPLDPADVVRRAVAEAVDLVVIGPEAPLVAGVADAVLDAGIPVFGPTRDAARLEASKSFAKRIMEEAGVATARSYTCTTMDQVDAALTDLGAPHVVKDDALAAGKGVIVTDDRDDALAHARDCLSRDSGAVVVEDYLDGPEVSLFCLADGTTVVPLVPAQDFKRVGDADQGPNTGGMGAYSPLPWLPDTAVDEIVREVAVPVVARMAQRGTPFRGLLYCGLAMTCAGIRVVEFNVRFGDPETQVVLERLDSPLAPLLHAAATGTLADAPAPAWSADAAVTVVMASGGYPGPLDTGHEITGIDEAEALPGVHVIHAGTAETITSDPADVAAGCCGFEPDTALVNSGGRVLDVVGRARTVDEARTAAYAGVAKIHFDGEHHRTDIATWPAVLDAPGA
ncbi:phosphoribosylamine--glycine ligase [Actinomyces sp. B33]|uniref:phosphoribosylamine--glycine ligase n=1 Tax=Actinomyces sp. B33 TaxID=2942131 RepID=UPI00234164C1|nr:phosphoribosylamine--glycine ligase [Actinomyces sp. B33]MDC4232301.1 phosphoribosylamine--glycine ligase [Actinomyces sp. B33]